MLSSSEDEYICKTSGRVIYWDTPNMQIKKDINYKENYTKNVLEEKSGTSDENSIEEEMISLHDSDSDRLTFQTGATTEYRYKDKDYDTDQLSRKYEEIGSLDEFSDSGSSERAHVKGDGDYVVSNKGTTYSEKEILEVDKEKILVLDDYRANKKMGLKKQKKPGRKSKRRWFTNENECLIPTKEKSRSMCPEKIFFNEETINMPTYEASMECISNESLPRVIASKESFSKEETEEDEKTEISLEEVNNDPNQDKVEWLTDYVTSQVTNSEWNKNFMAKTMIIQNSVDLDVAQSEESAENIREIDEDHIESNEMNSDLLPSSSANSSITAVRQTKEPNIVQIQIEEQSDDESNKYECDSQCNHMNHVYYELSDSEENAHLTMRLKKLQFELTNMRKELAKTRLACEEERKLIREQERILSSSQSSQHVRVRCYRNAMPDNSLVLQRPYTAVPKSYSVDRDITRSLKVSDLSSSYELESKLRNSREDASAGYKATLDTLERLMNDELSNIQDNIGKLEPLSKMASNWEPEPELKSLVYRHDYTVKVISSQRQQESGQL